MLLRGGRFLAKCDGTVVTLPWLSDDDRFIKDDDDDDDDEETEERRFWVDIAEEPLSLSGSKWTKQTR